MSNSAKAAIALGVLCALLLGLVIGGRGTRSPESERYYARANRVLDRVSPEPVASGAVAESSELSERETLVADAKTIALAVMMYGNDHNDVLPGPNGFAAKLRPYMQKGEPDRLDSFRWAYPGGHFMSVDHSDSVELGHLEGKTGKAIAFLDGHTKWFPNSPLP